MFRSRGDKSSTISDDIRNDPDLRCCSDGDDLDDDNVEPRGGVGTKMRRRGSSTALRDLQREVDAALELFGREPADDSDCDGACYQFLSGGFDDPAAAAAVVARVDSAAAVESSLSEAKEEKFEDVPPIRFGDACDRNDDGYPPSTASTSVSNSSDWDFGDGSTATPQSSSSSHERVGGGGGGGGLYKTRSLLSIPPSLLSPIRSSDCLSDAATSERGGDDKAISSFGRVVHDELVAYHGEHVLGDRNFYVDFGSKSLRRVMEHYLAKARLQREEARRTAIDAVRTLNSKHCPTASRDVSESSYPIGSSYGVPYPSIRNELSFLYDVDTFPLDTLLAKTLEVDDLSKLHLDHPRSEDLGRLMAPLHNRSKRRAFHQCYDAFVTSHVIPLLHSQALANDVFYTNRHHLRRGRPQRIVYRYQAFPSIRILRPGESDGAGPRCDSARGHSVGNIGFHVPLTAASGTGALHVESRPGREDWHPLQAKSGPGLGFRFDSARCLRFGLKNATEATRVSIDFRIAVARAPEEEEEGGWCGRRRREGGRRLRLRDIEDPAAFAVPDDDYDPDDQLCPREVLKDDYSRAGPGYYEEVIVNVGDTPRSFLPDPVAMKRLSSAGKLFDPDARVGFPFNS